MFRDPPEHTRLRRLAAKVFNVRSINALRPHIEAITRWLLASLDGREDLDVGEMAALFRDVIALRRHAPQNDLLTEMVQLEDEGERLSDDELVATCVLLLFAGHETTSRTRARRHRRAAALRWTDRGSGAHRAGTAGLAWQGAPKG